jgi:hypothetical protein
MTYQIKDKISIDDRKYTIERCTSREQLFNPHAYGIQTVEASSACCLGFYCDYVIVDRQLLLMNVNIEPTMPDRLKFKYGRSQRLLFGKSPQLWNDIVGTSWSYRDLCHSLPYSGGILLANGDILMKPASNLYHPLYVYEKVCEAIFEAGRLISFVDYSDRMLEIRDRIIGSNDKAMSAIDSYPLEIERQILAKYFPHQYYE